MRIQMTSVDNDRYCMDLSNDKWVTIATDIDWFLDLLNDEEVDVENNWFRVVDV